MAFTNTTIDPTRPSDTDLASEGDDEIRKLKLDLLERLGSFFEDLDTDPLKPKDGAIDFPAQIHRIGVGALSARPAKPGPLLAYYAVDVRTLYLSNGESDPAWDLYNLALLTAAPSMHVENVPQYFPQIVVPGSYPTLGGASLTVIGNVAISDSPGPLLPLKMLANVHPRQYSFKGVRCRINSGNPPDGSQTQFWAFGIGSKAMAPTHPINGLFVGVFNVFTQSTTEPGAPAGNVDWYVMYQIDNKTGAAQAYNTQIRLELWEHKLAPAS